MHSSPPASCVLRPLTAALCLWLACGCSAPSKTFVIISDLHPDDRPEAVAEMRSLTDHVVALKPAFAIVLGDIGNQNIPGVTEKEVQLIGECFRKMRAAGIEIFPVMGNHDVYWRVEDVKVKWFLEQEPQPLNRLMRKGAAGGAYEAFANKGPYDYSFTRGGIHFVIVDSNVVAPRQGWEAERVKRETPRWQAHEKWLREEIVQNKTNPKKCPTLVFLHQPEYATGDRGFAERPVYRMLEESKGAHTVKAVFGGHWHGGANLPGARGLGVEVYATQLSVIGAPDDLFIVAEITGEGLRFHTVNSSTGRPQQGVVQYQPIPGSFSDLSK